MKHFATTRFWKHYHSLPPSLQRIADKSFALLKNSPSHPSLHLKKVGRFWSARVGLSHRVLAVEAGDGWLWIWIGDHEEYERLINSE